MAKVCCSIEMEPRTLREGQLNYAREVAADEIQKMEPKEASNTFTSTGSRQVASPREAGQKEGDENHQDNHKSPNEKVIVGIPCQCACTTNNMESPDDDNKFEEPLTAPF